MENWDNATLEIRIINEYHFILIIELIVVHYYQIWKL